MTVISVSDIRLFKGTDANVLTPCHFYPRAKFGKKTCNENCKKSEKDKDQRDHKEQKSDLIPDICSTVSCTSLLAGDGTKEEGCGVEKTRCDEGEVR